uniref:Secreted protein n=1 Tax=Romanomermis culicivorax TaxID=13658 RepID=A0A915KM43_ROMCU
MKTYFLTQIGLVLLINSQSQVVFSTLFVFFGFSFTSSTLPSSSSSFSAVSGLSSAGFSSSSSTAPLVDDSTTFCTKSAVPDLAIVPKFLINSSCVIPIPESVRIEIPERPKYEKVAAHRYASL